MGGFKNYNDRRTDTYLSSVGEEPTPGPELRQKVWTVFRTNIDIAYMVLHSSTYEATSYTVSYQHYPLNFEASRHTHVVDSSWSAKHLYTDSTWFQFRSLRPLHQLQQYRAVETTIFVQLGHCVDGVQRYCHAERLVSTSSTHLLHEDDLLNEDNTEPHASIIEHLGAVSEAGPCLRAQC